MGASAGPEQLRRLCEAVLVVGSDLDLRVVLDRIVRAAVDLVDARYGALGVLDESRSQLAEFLTVGVDEETRERIGHLPKGLGVLGHLITDATPLRLRDLSEHPESAGMPAQHPPMHSFLGVPIRVRGEVFGNLYLTDKRNAVEFAAVDEELVRSLAVAAGIAIENARLYDRSRRRESALAAIQQIAVDLLEGSEGDDTLVRVARHAYALADADTASVSLPEPEGDVLQVAVAEGMLADRLLGQRFSRAGSVSGDVLDSGDIVVIDDARTDRRVAQPIVRAGEFGPAMFLPLRGDRETIGTLAVLRRAGARPFGPTDVDLVASFATQAGVALAHERHRQELQRLALLEDQERIARDLHDSVIQRVFAAGLSLQGAAAMVHDEGVRNRIERAIDELDAANRQIRAVIFDIGRRTPRSEESVRRRVLDLTAEAGRALGTTPRVLFSGPVDTMVTERVAAELLPTLREALSNVVRHAGATVVEVDLQADTKQVTLYVRDDGVGLAEGQDGGKGLGNMRVRAEQIGGTCSIRPGEHGGTVVEWRAPMGER